MQKLLLVANVSKEHIRKFHIPFILRLRSMGWQVDVACRLDEPIPECDNAYDLPCDRNPFKGGITKSVGILKEIIGRNGYTIVLCNTVVGSIIARLAAETFRKNGLKVIYLNHGLHFFPGAPTSRWVMGYPVEKMLASKTDVLITINKTDFTTARKYFKIKSVEKIHGMGVELHRFKNSNPTDEQKAMDKIMFGFKSDDFLLCNVAEINSNKNQKMLIKMLLLLRKNVPNAKLLLIGPEHDGGRLRRLIAKNQLQDDVLLLGWRNDVPSLLQIADVYVASSKSEGLPINIIEAMASGLPVVASRNRGHIDLIENEVNGCLVDLNDYQDMATKVLKLHDNALFRQSIIACAQGSVKQYEKQVTLTELCEIVLRHA